MESMIDTGRVMTELDLVLPHPMTRGDIVVSLRNEIIANRLPPGSLLPTRTELIARFDSTSATVQHAIDILRREGFVYAMGRRGTFVSTHPPHLFRFAMVFRGSMTEAHSNRLYQQLCKQAAQDGDEQNPSWRIEIHYGVENHVDNRELKAITSSARARSLAGLILPENPFVTGLAATEIGNIATLPRVTLTSSDTEVMLKWGSVGFGEWSTLTVRHLAEAGCRRVAVLMNHPAHARLEPELSRLLTAHGLRTPPHWFLRAPLNGAICARNIVHLLMSLPPEERPDGLLITNDTLMEDAVAGVVASGVRVPSELRIVSHCNFPWPSPSAVPVTRIGYETRDLMAACLAELAAQQQGAAPGKRVVQATFERGATGERTQETEVTKEDKR